MLEQRQSHHQIRHPLAAGGVRDLLHVFDQARNVQELRHWTHLASFLINHDGRAHPAVRVTTAGDLAPIGIRPVHEIRKVSKGAHQ